MRMLGSPRVTKDNLDQVTMTSERTVWRDVNVALSCNADPAAKAFLDFLITKDAQKLMGSVGWIR